MQIGRLQIAELGFNGPRQVYALYALALSADGTMLAAGGIGGLAPHKLVLLHADTGAIAASYAEQQLASGSGVGFGSSVGALAWHPRGWLAVGSSAGVVLHLVPGGDMRAYRASPRGIEALAFINGGTTLVVAGGECHLRAWPLLADEIETASISPC
ncbi:MAG: hypothetical protein MUD01_08610 [Chloroflexaceae bacterium]|nr:hypothetical protein [Chloroflexaceae bacterium]